VIVPTGVCGKIRVNKIHGQDTQYSYACICFSYVGSTLLSSALFYRSDSSSAADFRDGPANFRRKRNVLSVARNYFPDDQAYDGIRNPYVLVINNVNFYKDPRPRNGARHDLDNLKRFMKEAGFRSGEERIYSDLRKKQMLNILELTRLDGALGE